MTKESTMKLSKNTFEDRLPKGRAGRLQSLTRGLMVLATFCVAGTAGHANAQTAPPYVVYSQTVLSTGFNGAKANYAVNSRGDFFANDGNGHVLEYPANGGAPITLWTDTNNYGVSGVAVDPADNLYVTNFYGPGGNNDVDSQIYEFPSTNGSYPAPYVYNASSPPGSCTPAMAATATTPAVLANTGVCAVGLYIGAADYYWQPVGFAADGQGNTYMFAAYDNHYLSTSHGIFQCQLACNEQLAGNGATTYTTTLSTSISSIAADYAGNVYYTDQTGVFIIPAGSPSTNNAPAIFDATFTTPYGVTVDASGNLYVSDANGIWEMPSVETAGGAPCKGGADACKLVNSAKYKLIPLNGLPTNGLASAAVDNRGNIVYSPSGNGGTTNLFEASLWSGTFPASQVGATSLTTLQFTINFDSATTLTQFSAVQGAVPATEFTVSPGTCVVGSAFAAGSTCNFTATFTPSGLGVRTGAVLVADTTGKTTVTNLTGVGSGTGIAVDPGTPNQIGSGFKKPAGIAVDGSGNVFIADSAANKVQEYPAGNGAAVSIGTGLSVPTGVAVDGAGNVFIVNQGTGATGGSVIEVPVVGGVLTNTAQTTVVSGLNLPTDVIVDGTGDLYVSNTGANQVLQFASVTRDAGSAAQVVRGYGLSGPMGLALDASGNLYVADTGNNRVLEIGDGFQIGVGSGLSAPTGVAVDPSGSVMIADGTGRLVRVPNESFGMNPIGLNQADQQVLGSPLSYPYAVRSDNAGNLYVTDNTAAVAYQLQRTAGTVNFGNWNLNTMSDAQTIVLSNIGTTDLTFANPLYAPVPASSEFAVNIPSASSACGSGVFHSGYSCTLLSSFTPTALGTQTYPVTFNAPAQNAAAPSVKLVGTGVSEAAATLKLTQTAPTSATISYGQQIIISAKVTPTNSTVVPTGYLVFTFNGQNQRPIKLDATGSASITLNGLNAGSNTLSAFYEGDATYASLVSSVLPLIIVQATETNVLTIVGDSAAPLSSTSMSSFTLTDTLSPSVVGVFTGTVTFQNLTTGASTTAMRLGSPDPKTGLYVVSMNITGISGFFGMQMPNYAAGAQATGNIVAVFSGNTNYVPSTSAAIAYTISNSTFTISTSTPSVTASASTPGLINLTVTDFSNFQGAVSLQCTGLPANAYCVFRPGSAQLTPAAGLLPNTNLTPLTINAVPVTLQVFVDQNPVTIESPTGFFWVGGLALGFTLLLRRKIFNGRLNLTAVAALLTIAGITALSGCGASSNAYATAAGTYAVVITGTATPLSSTGVEPPCQYVNCTLPYDPVTNPSINVIKTVPLSLTVK